MVEKKVSLDAVIEDVSKWFLSDVVLQYYRNDRKERELFGISLLEKLGLEDEEIAKNVVGSAIVNKSPLEIMSNFSTTANIICYIDRKNISLFHFIIEEYVKLATPKFIYNALEEIKKSQEYMKLRVTQKSLEDNHAKSITYLDSVKKCELQFEINGRQEYINDLKTDQSRLIYRIGWIKEFMDKMNYDAGKEIFNQEKYNGAKEAMVALETEIGERYKYVFNELQWLKDTLEKKFHKYKKLEEAEAVKLQKKAPWYGGLFQRLHPTANRNL